MLATAENAITWLFDHPDPLVVLWVIAWIANGIRMFAAGMRMTDYLQQHHHERWRYLTSVPWMGIESGGVNSFRYVPWLYSDQDNDDPEVVAIKKQTKRNLRITLSILVAMPVSLFLLFVIGLTLHLLSCMLH